MTIAGGGVLYAATLTPAWPDGRCDTGRLARHCRRLLDAGCDGVSIFGTTGEGPSYSVAERMEALEALVAAGIPAKDILVGVICTAPTDIVQLTAHAIRQGCADILILPPFYFRGIGDDGVFRLYAECIERIGAERLRLYLYNFPALSGVVLGPELLSRLVARYPTVIAGVKDSSGDWSYIEALRARLPNLEAFTGAEVLVPRLLHAGGTGAISGMANVIPELMRALVDTRPADPHDPLLANIRALVEEVVRVPVVPALKVLAAHFDRDRIWEHLRPPLMPLDAADRQRLLAAVPDAALTLRKSA